MSDNNRRDFDPQFDVPVNITKIFEERHANRAVFAITIALESYMPTYSSEHTGFYTEHYYWVCLGPLPLSKGLQEIIRKKFSTSYGSLLFKNHVQMKSEYPEVFSYFYSKHKKSEFASFVGLPLPEEDCLIDSSGGNNEGDKIIEDNSAN